MWYKTMGLETTKWIPWGQLSTLKGQNRQGEMILYTSLPWHPSFINAWAWTVLLARCTISIADLKENVGETTGANLELIAESGNTNGWNKRDGGEIQNVGQAHSALAIKCLPSAAASFCSHPCSLHSEQCNVSIFFKFKDTKSLSVPLASTE